MSWISGASNAWGLASAGEGQAQFVSVDLEIQGDDKSGLHLVMAPKGFFTADDWFSTLDEAFETAEERFGIGLKAWSQETK